MSKIKNRDTAPGSGAPVELRLVRWLDSPSLARVVPHLPAETLHQLIRTRGLDACGELVTAATPAQLTALLDLDLWRHDRPGRDEQFDADRFGDWIEALVDVDDGVAARTVAALDPQLVIAGLCRYVRVFDPGIFEPTAQSDDETIDRREAMREGDAIHSRGATARDSIGGLECEVAGFIVRARRPDAWDAIVALLAALAAGHERCFSAVMRGVCALSNSRPEIDGLDDLLMAPEQQLHEVAIEREQRRARQGYSTPADARAFLQTARQPPQIRSATSAGWNYRNPIVTAYFRAADEPGEPSTEPARSASLALNRGDAPDSLDAVIDLLAEAGVVPDRPRALLEAGATDPRAARLTHLRRYMTHLHDTNATAFAARSRELAFLANTLLAGCAIQSRPFTPAEASDAAAAICNLGLECSAEPTTALPETWLTDHDLVHAFEAGWSVLHHDVSLFAVDQLIAALDTLDCVDRDVRVDLTRLKRALSQARDAGRPWQARGAAEILSMLDATIWISVLGLLDECPTIPAALTAVLDGRTTTISPTAFDFISTADQIRRVRAFARRLPELLSR